MGEERGVYRVLVGKPEGRRPMGRPRRRWVDNIRMDLCHLAQLMSSDFNSRFEVRKCLLSFGAESFVFQVAIQKFKD